MRDIFEQIGEPLTELEMAKLTEATSVLPEVQHLVRRLCFEVGTKREQIDALKVELRAIQNEVAEELRKRLDAESPLKPGEVAAALDQARFVMNAVNETNALKDAFITIRDLISKGPFDNLEDAGEVIVAVHQVAWKALAR